MLIYLAMAGAIAIIGVIIGAGVLIIFLGLRNKDKIGSRWMQGLILSAGIIVATIGSLIAGAWILYVMSPR